MDACFLQQIQTLFLLSFIWTLVAAENADANFSIMRVIQQKQGGRVAESSTNFAVSRLIFKEEPVNGNELNENEDGSEKKKPLLCSCADVNLCERLGRAEVEFCARKCRSHLASYGVFDKVKECFVETQQELELWSNCVKMKREGFCSPSNSSLSSSNSTLANQFVYKTSETYTEFLNQDVSTQTRKARRVYVHFRSYQHCFNECAKRAESQCLMSNGCRTNYPSEPNLRQLFDDQCDGLQPKALHSALNSCECLLKRHGHVRLFNLCPLIGNRFVMTVL